MTNRVLELARENHDFMVAFRRDLHKHPERSLAEFETTKKIRRELDAMGIPWTEVTPTGTVAVIEGSGSCDKVVGLRGDIDALEVPENNGTEFDSTVPGLSHACGHDAHAASLLGAAKIFKALGKENIPGRVVLVFQPAEEVGKGAKLMCESGLMPKLDAFYGQHLAAGHEVGEISSTSGDAAAGVSAFRITVKGKGGHGSAINLCKDPILVGAAIELALHTVVGQNIDGGHQASVCIGKFNAGSRFNVVPDEAVLEGNIRYLQREAGAILKKRLGEIVENTAKAYDMEASIEYFIDLPALYNDPGLYKIVEKAGIELVGDSFLVDKPEMGSEDFPNFAPLCPLVYGRIGSGNKAKGIICGHHASDFRIDEECLDYGAAMYVQFALDYFEAQK